MDKEKAISILIANVVCSETGLSCYECPLYDENKTGIECESFDSEDLIEAVNALKP